MFVIGAACAVSANAQDDVTGAYADADVADKDVVAAANFAVKRFSGSNSKKLKLVSVEKAEVQVVAGLNFRLCLAVDDRTTGKTVRRQASAVVYRNLKNKHKLTSWKTGECESD